MKTGLYVVHPIAWVHSSLEHRADAPKQGFEGAPDARLEFLPEFAQALDGIEVGQEILILTWLHEAQRDVLKVHPRDDLHIRLTGFVAWVAWLFLHLLYLVGFRNRLSVLVSWGWSYLTWDRGPRLILEPHDPTDGDIGR